MMDIGDNRPSRIMLLVGNDQKVMQALQTLFEIRGYHLLLANSGEAALQILQNASQAERIGVIVAENKMLTMSGIRFLSHAKELCDRAVRILITSELDMVSAMAAVNKSGLFRVFSVPWKDETLLDSVEYAFNQFELAYENKRLTEELEEANKGLITLNKNLEEKVKQKAEELVRATHYDSLTGLPSRNLMMERLSHVLNYAKYSQNEVVILYVGLDNFTRVNEGLGSIAGDTVLTMIAERLSSMVTGNDMLARIGSDEFCLLISHAAPINEADMLAKNVTDMMLLPFEIEGREIVNTASVGISLFPNDGSDADLLVSKAQTAMRQVKADGKNHFQYYSKKLNHIANKRLAIESELRQALDRDEFLLYYQPRINITTGAIVGVEALIRWNHPQKGIVPPLDFLPILEETGLINSVGVWVLKEACRAIMRWQEKNLPEISVAVNLSAKQFKGDIIDLVKRVSEHTGFDLKSSRLELEITESLLMDNIDKTKDTLAAFKNMGINLALDDFGTGYSSLSYLTQFPLHYLKIDRSFVSQVTHHDSARSVIEAIISLSRALHLEVIAEGVETQEQLEILEKMGCREFQGYLFSTPLPEDDLVQLLQSNLQLDLSVPPEGKDADHYSDKTLH